MKNRSSCGADYRFQDRAEQRAKSAGRDLELIGNGYGVHGTEYSVRQCRSAGVRNSAAGRKFIDKLKARWLKRAVKLGRGAPKRGAKWRISWVPKGAPKRALFWRTCAKRFGVFARGQKRQEEKFLENSWGGAGGSQGTGDRGQKEIRSQRSEVRSQWPVVRAMGIEGSRAAAGDIAIALQFGVMRCISDFR